MRYQVRGKLMIPDPCETLEQETHNLFHSINSVTGQKLHPGVVFHRGSLCTKPGPLSFTIQCIPQAHKRVLERVFLGTRARTKSWDNEQQTLWHWQPLLTIISSTQHVSNTMSATNPLSFAASYTHQLCSARFPLLLLLKLDWTQDRAEGTSFQVPLYYYILAAPHTIYPSIFSVEQTLSIGLTIPGWPD